MNKFLREWKFDGLSIKKALYQAVFYTFMLFACLQIFSQFRIDHYIQNLFFDFRNNQWLVSKENIPLRAIFYYGTKYGIIAFGCVLITLLIRDYRNAKVYDSRAFLFVILCLIIIPSLMAYLKHLTGIPCPYLLKEYGGALDYRNFLKPHWPDGTDRPSCFPAGHPSGGFALLALAYVAKSKKKVTILALILGIIMSLYQMARGAHFVSHCLITLFLSLIMINIIYICMVKFGKKQA